MFAVPANPVPRTLLTDEEVRHLYGKQRCLNKLFDNPVCFYSIVNKAYTILQRVAHPAIHQTVVFIFDSLSSIIALNKLPHTKVSSIVIHSIPHTDTY